MKYTNQGLIATMEHYKEPMRRLCEIEAYGECVFHMFFVKSWTHGAAISVGGFPAGQESHAMALVETEEGAIVEVPATDVYFVDKEESVAGEQA